MEESEIKEKIKLFLEPSKKKVHGRAIHRREAKGCGLNIEMWEVTESRWEALYSLYLRTYQFLVTRGVKVVETGNDAWFAPTGG